jgi:hypothetical protein
VPEYPMRLDHPWPARRISQGGEEPSTGERAFSVRVTDGGPTPNPGWHRGRWLPSVQRALISISSGDAEDGMTMHGSLHVDMEFVRSLRQGDVVYLARTPCAGTGISVIRGETLAAAAGAVTAVPHGRDLVVRYPAEVMQAVEALFQEIDPDYEPPELPLVIETHGLCHLFYRGTRKMGPYRIYMSRGFQPGMPGSDECLAISREGFSETAVTSTAQLLGRGEVEREL